VHEEGEGGVQAKDWPCHVWPCFLRFTVKTRGLEADRVAREGGEVDGLGPSRLARLVEAHSPARHAARIEWGHAMGQQQRHQGQWGSSRAAASNTLHGQRHQGHAPRIEWGHAAQSRAGTDSRHQAQNIACQTPCPIRGITRRHAIGNQDMVRTVHPIPHGPRGPRHGHPIPCGSPHSLATMVTARSSGHPIPLAQQHASFTSHTANDTCWVSRETMKRAESAAWPNIAYLRISVALVRCIPRSVLRVLPGRGRRLAQGMPKQLYETIIGLTLIGLTINGLTIIGLTIIGLTIIGLTIIGLTGIPNRDAQAANGVR
jgi:hypothetical protein